MTPSPSPSSAVRAAVDEMLGLLEKATPGPWGYVTDSCDCGGGYPCSHEDWPHQLVGPQNVNASPNFPSTHNEVDEIADLTIADAALIVAAVNALPHLLAAIKAVDELADELETQAQARERIADSGSPGVNQYALREGARAQRAQAAALRAALALAAVDVTETAE